jgi:small-conductance mechanosensitive channel
MNITKHLFVLTFLLFLGLFLPVGSAYSAETQGSREWVDVPPALGPEAMTNLVSKLDAEQTNALVKLMELLNVTAENAPDATAADQAHMMDTLQVWLSGFGETIVSHLITLPNMAAGMGEALARIFTGRGLGGSLLFLALLALVAGIAMAVEWLLNKTFPQRHSLIKGDSPDSLLGTLKVLSIRAFIQAVDIIVFVLAFVTTARIVFPDIDDRAIVFAVLKAVLIIRFSAAVLQFVLAPRRADLRLVSTDAQTAQFLYRHLMIVVTISGIGFFMVGLMVRGGIDGVPTLRFVVGLLIVLWVMLTTWRARNGLTSIIIGEEENLTPGLEKMASWWPRISIVIIGMVWLIIQFIISTGSGIITPGRGALSLALIVVLPFIDTMVRGISGHLVPQMEGSGPVAEKAYEESRHSYVRIGRIFLFAAIILLLAKLLGLNLRELAASGLGTEIASHALGFLLILAGGYIAYEVTNLWINRRLARELPDEGDEAEEGGSGMSRMVTILPIMRMTLHATIVVLTVLLALGQLGVNITPLLAGAGVLGLAIGFGAQTLVKDVVSGVFFLLDDAFRMGEYIDVGGMPGTVQKISIRSMHLRDAKGPIHIVPYGSISKLTNMSRDWVIMKLKFIVPFDTDIEKVRKLFKKIGLQILAESEYREDILAPFKSQGPADVNDIGIVIRGKFTTKPGGQWMIRREIYTAVQKEFKENGIEFARKEVRVQMPNSEEDARLSVEQKTAIARAASEGAEKPKS